MQLSLPQRRSIGWYDGKVRFIDQRGLPRKLEVIETDDSFVIAEAIRTLAIRGAPLIGVAAALGVAATAVKYQNETCLNREIEKTIDGLRGTRPTAGNLFWALDQMSEILSDLHNRESLVNDLTAKAIDLMIDDERCCEKIGNNAQSLIGERSRILTICNTGFLATAGDGTALSAVYRAHDEEKNIEVFVCETRPLLQGARLTAWELTQAEVPFTLIVDSAAAGLIRQRKIDICIIGADRIAANGDTVNKIGSYHLALACKEHDVPFYVAAPRSTVDRSCLTGLNIPIEERGSEEITDIGSATITVDGVKAYNPAFDLVPADYITGIITEDGVVQPPFNL